VGLASQIDVLRAEIQLSEALDNLEAAREALRDAEDRMKLTLGLSPAATLVIEGKIRYSPTRLTETAAVETALSHRLDLREEWDKIRDARRRHRVAKNDVLPALDLSLKYLWAGTGETAGQSTRLADYGWTIGLTTSTDLRRTAERARLEQRRIDIVTSRRDYADLQDRVVREVRREIRSLNKNLARIDIQEKNLSHAKRQLQLARLQFVKGLADNFDVIDAEQRLIRTESQYIQVVTEYILSQFRLRRAMGTLTDQPAYLRGEVREAAAGGESAG
jgi:outer membrane protein TolC